MTQQPEFTPRRGSVSSHYQSPREAGYKSPDDPNRNRYLKDRIYLLAAAASVFVIVMVSQQWDELLAWIRKAFP